MSNQVRSNLALLVLRITFGGLMLTHGWPKLMKLIEGEHSFSDPIGIGPFWSLLLTVFAEFFCAIFVIVGWRVRLFVWPLIVAMAVAAFVVHAGDPIAKQEKALLFLAGFIAIGLLGSGKYSLNKLL